MAGLHIISIVLEAVIVVIALLIGLQRRRGYGFGFALTFTMYVLYDLANQFHFAIMANVLIAIFFIATVSALASMWRLYTGK